MGGRHRQQDNHNDQRADHMPYRGEPVEVGGDLGAHGVQETVTHQNSCTQHNTNETLSVTDCPLLPVSIGEGGGAGGRGEAGGGEGSGRRGGRAGVRHEDAEDPGLETAYTSCIKASHSKEGPSQSELAH